MGTAIRKTTEELFGKRKTSTELFDEGVSVQDFKIKEDIPSGDKFIFGPQPFRKPVPDIFMRYLPEDTNWDELLPMEDRVEIRDALVDWGDYNEDGSRAVNSIFFGNQLGISPESANLIHDDLASILYDEDGPPLKVFERIKDRFHNGRTQIKMSDEGFGLITDMLNGRPYDPEKLENIKSLQSQMRGDYMKDLRSWYEKMLGASAEQLPNIWEGIKVAPIGAGAGAILGATIAAVAGQLGPQALMPEEIVSVPATAAYGAKIGGGIAVGVRIGQIEAGGMMLEFLDMKDENGKSIDPRIAIAASLAVGSINGAIEVAEWVVLLSTFGIGTKIFENATQKVTTKLLAEGTLKQIVAKHIVKYGAVITAEILQELGQETSSIVFGELAKAINNEAKGTEFTPITAAALRERYYETAAETLRAVAVLAAPGTIITGAIEAIKAKPIEPEVKIEKVKPKPIEPLKEIMQAKEPQVTEEIIAQEIETPEKVPVQPETIPTEVIEKPEEEPPLTVEETSALEKLEADIKIEDAEIVKPHLYIGNVTRRMKKVLAAVFNRQPEDVRGFTEEGFPTKRTDIEMTRGEAMQYLEWLEDDILRRLEENEVRTENDLAWANADWGDIVALRETLGMEKDKRPFKVIRAEKHKMVIIKNTKSRMWAAIRPDTINDAHLTVGQILGVTMKRMAQAARHAFSVGKKEGAAKMRAHYREVKRRERARKKLKQRVRKAVKTITEPLGKSVDFFYREAIEALGYDIDFKPRSKKTKNKRARMREFLKRAVPEELADFPVDLMKSLAKKPFVEYTLKELEQLAIEVEKLKKLGKTKQKARTATEKAERERNIREIVTNIVGTDILPKQQPQGFETNKEGIIKRLLGLQLLSLRIPRILDWLDGRKGTFKGIMHKLFYERVNEQLDAEHNMTDSRHDSGTAEMQELGITDRDLVEKIDFSNLVSGFTLLKEQMMGIYAAVKNNMSLDALIHGNKITEKMAAIIISNLEQKYKDLADWIVEEYDSSYARLRRAHIEFKGEDLGLEENYTAMVRLEKNDTVINEEIADQLTQRLGLRRGYEKKGFTKKRKDIAPEHQKKIDLRLISVWRSQTALQEHYIHFAKLTKDLRAMLADTRLAQAITQKLGKEAKTILDNYVSRVANPNIYKGFGSIEKMSRQARQNVAMAYLAYNLLTIAKQIPSVVLYMKDAGPTALISSIAEFAADPKKMWAEVRKKDPQVKHAHIERELEELKRVNQDAHQKIIKRIGTTGMLGIGIMDGIARTIGWNAVYQKSKQLGMSENESIRESQHSTLRTQPAAHAKDIAQLYATNEFLNWFTMFTNQLNQIWNITSYDTFAYWNNKDYQAVAATAFAVGLNALLIWAITNKSLPDDEDDLLEAAEEQALNIIPLVGKSISAGKKGWGDSGFPPFEATKSLGRVLSAKDKEDAAIKFLETAAALKGIPIVGIKRGAKFLETGKPIELIGGEKKKGKKVRL